VVGFRDGHDFGSVGKDVPVYCAAAAVTAGQLVRVLIRWLEANPAQLHEPAGLLAALAYKDAFPCR
jgi:hypothetical protein